MWEKAFDKIQHPFVIKKKKKQKLRPDGKYLNTIKGIYEKFPANIIFGEHWKFCPSYWE